MTDRELDKLLKSRESETLDFKADYNFTKSTEVKKSEFLKDILAFANCSRSVPAYILVGVQEVKGGKSTPIGVKEHLQPNSMQQFVNKKINTPLKFTVYPYSYKGIELDIVQIEVQEDLYFAKNSYGIVNENVIYTRIGETTSIVPPNEIYEFQSRRLHQSKLLEIAMSGKIDFDLDAKGAGMHKLRLKLFMTVESKLQSGPILNPQIELYQDKYRIKVIADGKAIHLGRSISIQSSTDYEKSNLRNEIEQVFTLTFGGDNTKLYYSKYKVKLFSTSELIHGSGNSVHMGPEYHIEVVPLSINTPVTTNNIWD